MQRERSEEAEYDLLLLLDRLESLLEDMDELGIRTREQLEIRIAEMHRKIDELEP